MPKKKIEIKDLELIFGKGEDRKRAIKMLHDGKSNDYIREHTNSAVGVRKVDIDIYEGEMFVIVGLSGSGKSSLIRCLNRINTPTNGEVLIDGENILNYSREELRDMRRHKVSMVFQHFGLFDHRNVISNVAYGLEVQGVDKEEREKRAMESVQAVGLEGWEYHKIEQLSGGMKQRVGLARALTNEPEIMLMDEPYSALDPLIRRDMQKELLGLEDYIDKTIVFITHDMNEAFKLGDRIALMKDGIIVQIGEPSDYFENPANEYVEEFIADVDKGQVLKAKQLMREPAYVANENDRRTTTRDALEKHDKSFCYVVDDKDVLLGYVTLDELNESRKQSIDSLIKEEPKALYRQLFLKEIYPLMEKGTTDVAIVDSKNRLHGVISYDDVIQALSI